MHRIMLACASLLFALNLHADEKIEIPHPNVSPHTEWMVIILILTAAIFVAALIAGPIIRANTKVEETPRHH
jgi:hypothetical protein